MERSSIRSDLLLIHPKPPDEITAQFCLSADCAQEIAQHLPSYRPTISDLNCGGGSLLASVANASTQFLIGPDIDPAPIENLTPKTLQVTADLPTLYPFLVQLNWIADLFVLHPPVDLHWCRSRLAFLDDSTLPAVAEAFRQTDLRLPENLIDSTIATLCVALDRLTYRGEGFLIADRDTLERLIFGYRAPYHCLEKHIWGRLSIPAYRVREGSLDALSLETEVIYFARDHYSYRRAPSGVSRVNRSGAQIVERLVHAGTAELWRETQREWRIQSTTEAPGYDLSLRRDGTIQVHFSVFDGNKRRISRVAAKELFQLRGKHPLQLVIQRSSRENLQKQLSLWNVDPALREAVDDALRQYHADHAPLYPLSPAQRLGYLDEHDFIACIYDLLEENVTLFVAGKSYPMRTATVPVSRLTQRRNLEGELESLELSGQDLAIYITAETKEEICFVPDPNLIEPEFQVRCLLNLSALTRHFEIPEVPDIANLHPIAFEQNFKALTRLEELVALTS